MRAKLTTLPPLAKGRSRSSSTRSGQSQARKADVSGKARAVSDRKRAISRAKVQNALSKEIGRNRRAPFKCKMVICTDAVCAQAEFRCANRVTILANLAVLRRKRSGLLALKQARNAKLKREEKCWHFSFERPRESARERQRPGGALKREARAQRVAAREVGSLPCKDRNWPKGQG